MIRTLRKSDVVVIGGGSSFRNLEWQIRYGDISQPIFNLFAREVLSKKFAAVGVGVSDGLSLFGRFALRRIALGADFFSVRDEASFLRLNALAPTANIHLSADPRFLRGALTKMRLDKISVDNSLLIVCQNRRCDAL